MEHGQRLMKRVAIGAAGVAGLAFVFLFQRTDVLALISQAQLSPEMHFSINRLARIFLNDIFMLLVLYALFADTRILKLALWVQVIDLLVLLPLYLVVKLSLEGDSEISSPFLSQFHRLIVNPTLMILIIPAVYYQRLARKDRQHP
ncbi:exosortase F system-associated protein [Fulvivirgaceae bacterium PWU4]|uniref:Exosortase F system-associated protein n=1 Tax=Chryseosolibacter histidini TaxID=2782349 RepID=A0AAP2DS58_9BACT|nr:exosortase F system-associated protein [Chryseosolibacter histidini]MBT1700504.1 exosortase F system-associated protein [Chryseosolibacter histidini]